MRLIMLTIGKLLTISLFVAGIMPTPLTYPPRPTIST